MTKEALELIAKDPHAFLAQGRYIEKCIKVKQRRIQHLQEISVSITTTIKPVSVYTGPRDKIGDCASEIVDLSKALEEDAKQLAGAQKEIAEAIASMLSDYTLRSIIEARYLSGMRWEEIAYVFNFAYRWVLRLHKRALNLLSTAAVERLRYAAESDESDEMTAETAVRKS